MIDCEFTLGIQKTYSIQCQFCYITLYGFGKISLHSSPKGKKLPVKNWLTHHASEILLLISIEVMGITQQIFFRTVLLLYSLVRLSNYAFLFIVVWKLWSCKYRCGFFIVEHITDIPPTFGPLHLAPILPRLSTRYCPCSCAMCICTYDL